MHDQEYVISALRSLAARVKRKKGFEIKLSCNDELISILSDAVQMLKEQDAEIKRLKGELHGFGDLFHMLSEKAKEVMAEQPEVVRCQYCKHGGMDTSSYPQYWCSAHGEYVKFNFFCGYGEKRD